MVDACFPKFALRSVSMSKSDKLFRFNFFVVYLQNSVLVKLALSVKVNNCLKCSSQKDLQPYYFLPAIL